ncbi:MAG: twin-arginine translocase subunit TatC [Candidatus Binatia bacterium]
MALHEILHHQYGTDNASNSPLTEPFEPETTREALGAEMRVIEHLEELRRRLCVCVVAVVIGALGTFCYYEPLLQFLLSPLPSQANALALHNGTPQLAVTGIGEGFSVVLKLALAGGAAFATPVWLSQFWAFFSPALQRRERRYALPFILIGVALFAAGLGVGFLTLRYPLNWLLSFGDTYFVTIITADNYFTFVAYFLLAFGLTFELPLVVTFFAAIGILSAHTLKQHRAAILVSLWIASCFITPGADPYSPLIVSLAFTVLYFVSEGLISLMSRQAGTAAYLSRSKRSYIERFDLR